MLFVRYEDLCTNPQETLKQVYEFIGEEPRSDWEDVLPKHVAEGIRQGTPWYFEQFQY